MIAIQTPTRFNNIPLLEIQHKDSFQHSAVDSDIWKYCPHSMYMCSIFYINLLLEEDGRPIHNWYLVDIKRIYDYF